jgi:hypothetical protein
VTFTLIFVDENEQPVDSNGDGRIDSGGSPLVDVEAIALHEAGHGLGQGHFGKLFFDGRGTQEPSLQHLHFAPRAVMNALYWETMREPRAADKATHCENWASWR